MSRRDRVAGWRLCVVTDRTLVRGRPLESVVEAAIAGGADVVQYRDKRVPGRVLCEQAARLLDICHGAGVPLIVNDRVDVCLAVGADGAHVGQEDLAADAARRLLGPERILGVSACTVQEARQAAAAGADYVGAGPVFDARSTKPDAAEPIGTAGLAEIAAVCPLPLMAIGGLDADRARAVCEAGASCLAVVSAVMAADDVRAAAAGLKAAADATVLRP